jgi:hypothetical protein
MSTTEHKYRPDMTREEFIAAAVEISKAEIIGMVGNGVISAYVESFGDLHDFVDANEIGGFCDEDLQPIFDQIFVHTEQDIINGTIASETEMDATNRVQDIVSAWITSGGLAGYQKRPKPRCDCGSSGYLSHNWKNRSCPRNNA